MKHFLFKRSVVMVTIFLLAGAIFIFSGEDRITGNPSHSAAPMKIIPPIEPVQNVLNIDTNTWYETIQDAIDAAYPGNRLFLEPITFEENVVVWKPVLISGDLSKNQVVDGGNSGYTFQITVDGVSIRMITIKNDGGYAGVKIESNSNLVYECIIQDCKEGVYLSSGTSANMLAENEIENSVMEGILLYESSENTIVGNTITGCPENGEMGILLAESSDNNTIYANTIEDNNNGIFISSSSNNMIYHNNFVNNTASSRIFGLCTGNQWHKGYPTGGNYWSDHTGADNYHGANQNIPGSDSACFTLIIFIDTPYYIPYGGGAHDKYPLFLQWNTTCY